MNQCTDRRSGAPSTTTIRGVTLSLLPLGHRVEGSHQQTKYQKNARFVYLFVLSTLLQEKSIPSVLACNSFRNYTVSTRVAGNWSRANAKPGHYKKGSNRDTNKSAYCCTGMNLLKHQQTPSSRRFPFHLQWQPTDAHGPSPKHVSR